MGGALIVKNLQETKCLSTVLQLLICPHVKVMDQPGALKPQRLKTSASSVKYTPQGRYADCNGNANIRHAGLKRRVRMCQAKPAHVCGKGHDIPVYSEIDDKAGQIVPTW